VSDIYSAWGKLLEEDFTPDALADLVAEARRQKWTKKQLRAAHQQSEVEARKHEKRIHRAAARAHAQPKKEKQLPTIEQYAQRFIEEMRAFKNPYSSILKEGHQMIHHLDDLDDALAHQLGDEIMAMVKRHSYFALSLAEAFEATNRTRLRLPVKGKEG
jgi:hypothetical protein